jgi:hypothetical protein
MHCYLKSVHISIVSRCLAAVTLNIFESLLGVVQVVERIIQSNGEAMLSTEETVLAFVRCSSQLEMFAKNY